MSYRNPVDAIVARAIANGEFDDLPGQGKPLELDDESGVPEDMRMSFRVMKNFGVAPPEVEELNKLAEMRATLAEENDPDERERLSQAISTHESVLRMKLERMAARR